MIGITSKMIAFAVLLRTAYAVSFAVSCNDCAKKLYKRTNTTRYSAAKLTRITAKTPK
jgi:sugar diacid utilization regulator